MLTTTEMILIVVAAAVVLVALFAFVSKRSSRSRHAELKQRFGPEYDRAVEHHGSVERAERDLLAREKRVNRQKLHPLSDADRARFSSAWQSAQTRFVDDPSGAVTAADDLIKEVMIARGYSSQSVEQRAEDLSVEHANVVEHYRAARVLADANREGRANTEELRQAFVHYRALFADLLETTKQPEARHMQEAPAS